MKFSLFRKQKEQSEPEEEAASPQEEPKQEVTPPEEPAPTQASPIQETVASVAENKAYLKAMPLKDLADVENVKNEVKNGNIIILRVTPLANKSIDDVKNAVNELYQFSESIGGDIARLGEERVVICPKNVRIWREKTPASNEPLPTAA
jgi:hypothetical protein